MGSFDPVRFGVIGSGWITRQHVAAFRSISEVDVVACADGILGQGTGSEEEFAAHGREWCENILEVDDGIDTESSGEERDFCGDFRVAEEVFEGPVDFFFEFIVGGVSPSGLAHHPNGRSLGFFATGGAYKEVVLVYLAHACFDSTG